MAATKGFPDFSNSLNWRLAAIKLSYNPLLSSGGLDNKRKSAPAIKSLCPEVMITPFTESSAIAFLATSKYG